MLSSAVSSNAIRGSRPTSRELLEWTAEPSTKARYSSAFAQRASTAFASVQGVRRAFGLEQEIARAALDCIKVGYRRYLAGLIKVGCRVAPHLQTGCSQSFGESAGALELARGPGEIKLTLWHRLNQPLGLRIQAVATRVDLSLTRSFKGRPQCLTP
jgi:hypothetical protein